MCEQVSVAVSFTKRVGVRIEQMPADVTGKVFKSYDPRICLSLVAILESMTFSKGHPHGIGIPSWF